MVFLLRHEECVLPNLMFCTELSNAIPKHLRRPLNGFLIWVSYPFTEMNLLLACNFIIRDLDAALAPPVDQRATLLHSATGKRGHVLRFLPSDETAFAARSLRAEPLENRDERRRPCFRLNLCIHSTSHRRLCR